MSIFWRSLRSCAAAASLCALLACGYRTRFVPTNTPPRAMKPRSADSVAMFTSSKPTRPFVEVGMLSSEHKGYFSSSTDEEVVLGLREKAAEVGCDGVILEAETTTEMATAGTMTASTKAIKKFRAACILYSDNGEPPAEKAAPTANTP